MTAFSKAAKAALDVKINEFKKANSDNIFIEFDIVDVISSIAEQNRSYHFNLAKLDIQRVILFLTSIDRESGSIDSVIKALRDAKDWIYIGSNRTVERAVKDIEGAIMFVGGPRAMDDDYLIGGNDPLDTVIKREIVDSLKEVVKNIKRGQMTKDEVEEEYVEYARKAIDA